MNRTWTATIFMITVILLSLLKSHEQKSLHVFIRSAPSLKINKFTEVKKELTPADQDLLELWESILTGRSAPLAKTMKETYQDLGLKHVFTPSGFHLSAVLSPFLKLSMSKKYHLSLLLLIGISLAFLPGFGALKRMVLIKGSQKLTGKKEGFILALLMDIIFGTFQHSPLSFSYSFLFLGIIYSGAYGIGLIFWFFVGQITLSYFQATLISPLLLIWCPILNFAFALAMPLLFILSIPLWNWQLHIGLTILGLIQKLITLAASTLHFTPLWEIHCGTLLLLGLFICRKFQFLPVLLMFLSNSLNHEQQRVPSAATYEYMPRGQMVKIRGDVVYYSDGKCKLRLVQGYWWEKCSPRNKRSKLR